jgi:hypothetical protein
MNTDRLPKSVTCRHCPCSMEYAQMLVAKPSVSGCASHLPSADSDGFTICHDGTREAGIVVTSVEAPESSERARIWYSGRPSVSWRATTERLPLEQLGDNVGGGFVDAHIVDGQDVRMVEAARRLRFLLESAAPFRIGLEGRWKNLDGDVALQLRIARAIDLPHPAGAERPENLEATQAIAPGEAHNSAMLIRSRRIQSM